MKRLPIDEIDEFHQKRILSLADRDEKFESVVKLFKLAQAKTLKTLSTTNVCDELNRCQGVYQFIEEFFEFINKPRED